LWQQVDKIEIDILPIFSGMLSSIFVNAKLRSSSEQPMASRIIQITFPSRTKSSSNPSSGNSTMVISMSVASSEATKEVCPSQ